MFVLFFSRSFGFLFGSFRFGLFCFFLRHQDLFGFRFGSRFGCGFLEIADLLLKDHLAFAGDIFRAFAGGGSKCFKAVACFAGSGFRLFIGIINGNICLSDDLFLLPLDRCTGLFTGVRCI